MGEWLLLFKIAFRNLFSSFLNLVIGGIILVGTLLFVVGGSVLGTVDSSMSKSITGSIGGHLQVYSDKSKDELSLFGDWNKPDISPMADFAKVRDSLMKVENVKAVIPMGIDGAAVTFGNTVDLILEKLRKAETERKEGNISLELSDRIDSLIAHVRRMVGVIQEDYKKLTVLSSERAIDPDAVKVLDKAASDEFWETYRKDPFGHLEFLENHIASLVPDADYGYVSYVGTDVDAFQKSFDRMEIVDGTMIPTGRRGILLSKYVYENQFKLKIARRLDQIREGITEKGKTIAKDPDLKLMVKKNQTQTKELLLQLDPLASKQVKELLATFLKSDESDLEKLFETFFDTNDVNFQERYDFFYKEIAPRVEIYRVRPGDLLTIKAFTKSGFVQSANLKVYGTFHFKGLEKSGLAGAMSLMDLMSFRDLYGYITPDKIAEAEELKKEAGITHVDRKDAENELFGGSATVVEQAKSTRINEKLDRISVDKNAQDRVYSQDEIDHGVALNAALILKDPTKLLETLQQIREVSGADGLGLRVVDWQAAAGNLGKFVMLAKGILYFAVFVIFIVALVIINNAVMMATLQRVKEIGTMRAIGAQKGFVLSLVIIETLVLGVVFGLMGTFLGSVIVQWLGRKGIAAANEFLYFFFAGPRLYVSFSWGSLIGALVIISVVTCISALYPAMVATRVSPLQAMQTEE